MATEVKNRTCRCGEKYRTKQKKGKDTRCCPACGRDNSNRR